MQFDQVDWTDRAQVIRVIVGYSRMLSGSAHPFDEARATRLIEQDLIGQGTSRAQQPLHAQRR